MVQFRPLLTELRHFEKTGAHHFSLIGRHLESVGRTELVFKLNLAPSEPTYGFPSDSGIYRVIVFFVCLVNIFIQEKYTTRSETEVKVAS